MALAPAVSNTVITDVTMNNLEEQIIEAGQNLRFATLALRSCFTVSASSVKEFVALRNDTMDEAQAYKQQVLPLALASTQSIKEFMEWFKELSQEDTLEIIEDIGDAARVNQQLMMITRDTHQVMSAKFKSKQDKIDKVLSACELQKKRYLRECEELKKSANSKMGWAWGLAFVPGVNLIACPILCAQAVDADIQAIAAAEEAQLAVNAAYVVQDVLANAINRYVKAMEVVAGTFQLLTSECEAFSKNADRLGETRKNQFYMLMNKKADKILEACDKYLVNATNAESDLMALPAASTPNYVEQWLAEQKKDENGLTFKARLLALGTSLPKPLRALTGR